jgi:hypothetical protein
MSQNFDPPRSRERLNWEVIELAIRENVGVEVSMLALEIPRFSFKVGTLRYPEDGDGTPRIGPWLSIFNCRDGIELLSEMEEKYTEARERAIEEVEARKTKIKENSAKRTSGPIITVKRSRHT